jgi:hypothetical protein
LYGRKEVYYCELKKACAEAAGADYFCTCDDNFLKKAKALKDSQMTALSPL